MTSRLTARKQIRSFVLVWTAITLMMGACTFVAIYTTYGVLSENASQNRNVAILPPTNTALQVVLNTTPIPTRGPLQTATAIVQPTATTPAETEEAGPPSPSATQLPIDERIFQVGVQVQESLDNQTLWMQTVRDQMYMHWIKQQVRWEDYEQEEDNYDWSVMDIVLHTASEHGLKVMISVVATPDWARESGADLSKHGPPADPSDLAEFIVELVDRYPGMVHGIEVWNEMNLDREWSSPRGLSAANYVTMLRTVYEAVKGVDPGVIVISGALSPTGGWTEPDGTVTALDDFVYLDQLVAAGMLNYADCVGAHHNGINVGPNLLWDQITNDPGATFRGPYDNPHHSWSFRSTLQTYAQKVALADGEQKLCVTEFGWATTEDMTGTPPGFAFADDNTLEEQAEYLVEAMNLMEEWDIVWLAFLWNLNYAPQAGFAPDNDNVPYSLIGGPDFYFRPAYDAVREWVQEYNERVGLS